MKAFRIGNTIIAAWFERDAVKFFFEQTGGQPPGPIEELDVEETLPEGGKIKDVINKVLDERNAWLRMGVPCELDWPFFIWKKI
jgi:hypothetical protein